MLRNLFALSLSLSLMGCSGIDVMDYKDQQPALDLKTYFNGQIEAWGMFQKRDGRVVKQFKVLIDAQWIGNQGVLDEQFTYSDGTRQQRIWSITKHPNGRYSGVADDVLGVAQGQAAGNSLQWQYTMMLPVDGKVYNVQFDDWMYLTDDYMLINRSVMKKFGFRLGEVTLFFRKK